MNSRRNFLRAAGAATAALFGLRKLATAAARPALPLISAPERVYWPELRMKFPKDVFTALLHKAPKDWKRAPEADEAALLVAIAERSIPPGWELFGITDPMTGKHNIDFAFYGYSDGRPDASVEIMAVNPEMIAVRANSNPSLSYVGDFDAAPLWKARYEAGRLDWVQVKGPTPQRYTKYGTKA